MLRSLIHTGSGRLYEDDNEDEPKDEYKYEQHPGCCNEHHTAPSQAFPEASSNDSSKLLSTSAIMRSNSFLLAASAFATATAQAPDLATAIQLQPTLTTLFFLLGAVSNTTGFLACQENVTLFAPNDEAFATIVKSGGIFSIDQASIDPGLIEQILRYHLYRGVVKAEDITPVPNFIHSFLNYSGFVLDGEVSGSNVTGGQVVSVILDEAGDALVTAGIKVASKVTVPVSRSHFQSDEGLS